MEQGYNAKMEKKYSGYGIYKTRYHNDSYLLSVTKFWNFV